MKYLPRDLLTAQKHTSRALHGKALGTVDLAVSSLEYFSSIFLQIRNPICLQHFGIVDWKMDLRIWNGVEASGILRVSGFRVGLWIHSATTCLNI